MLMLLLAFVIAPIFYPLVYPFRHNNWVRWKKPLYYFFDDEDGYYGARYWRKAKGIKDMSFWTSYRWSALRNPMWNLHASAKPVSGDEVYLKQYGRLTRGFQELALSNVAVMMYEDDEGVWMHNSGDNLSTTYSIFGWTFIIFTIQDKLYWRYSYVGNTFSKLWLEIQLGIGWRYTFRLKAKWNPNIK